jgi:lysophospholipase L1-like esterase
VLPTASHSTRRPASPAGPSNELRVICLGDSISFGLGSTEDDNRPRRPERILAESPEPEGRPIVVVNAGVPGWNSVQGMRRYREIGPQGDWDFVVFCFGLHDARPAAGMGAAPGARRAGEAIAKEILRRLGAAPR